MNIALQHSELSAHSCVRERYITWHARLDAVCVSSGVSGVGRLVVLVVCVCVPPEWSRECGHTEWSVRFGGLKVDKLDRMAWPRSTNDRPRPFLISYYGESGLLENEPTVPADLHRPP